MMILIGLIYFITASVFASGKQCIAPVYCTGENDHQPGWMQVYPPLRCGGNATCAKHQGNMMLFERNEILYKNVTDSLRKELANLTKSNELLHANLINIRSSMDRLFDNNTKLYERNTRLSEELRDLSRDNTDLKNKITLLNQRSVEQANAIAKLDEFKLKIGQNAIRLVNGSSYKSGRIEVLHNRMWGTVCDDDWTKNNGDVVCKQLGFSKSIWNSVDNSNMHKYGNGTGKIWLDGVVCIGNEAFISDSPHEHWGQNNCRHSEDAEVECE